MPLLTLRAEFFRKFFPQMFWQIGISARSWTRLSCSAAKSAPRDISAHRDQGQVLPVPDGLIPVLYLSVYLFRLFFASEKFYLNLPESAHLFKQYFSLPSQKKVV